MLKVQPLPNGMQIADYLVRSVIGHGGFGTTYLCEDAHLRKLFVIKELTPNGLVRRLDNGDLEALGHLHREPFKRMREAFLKEAQALAKFSHSNIARAVRYFEQHNTAYLVMEHEPGSNLRAFLSDRDGALTEHELEVILRPLCEGLDELHALGLIHRDIKPDNVLIRHDGSPVLLDFGAVIPFGAASDVIFTPGYAPPEQLASRFGVQGAWTDIYSIGAMLYEVIEGKPPPDAAWRVTQANEASLYPRSGTGKYSTRILRLVERCLALDVKERPQSMRDVMQALRNDDEAILGAILKDTAYKLTAHMLNWATPNDDLYVDEFSAFAIVFPVIDLSWRIGAGIPDKALLLKLLRASHLGADAVGQCAALIVEKGFARTRGAPGNNLCAARILDYASAYLLDRQAEQWTYDLLRMQLVRHCLSSTASDADRKGFSELMEDVIDRARGLVEREFRKQTSSVAWYLNEDGTGWLKRLRVPPSTA